MSSDAATPIPFDPDVGEIPDSLSMAGQAGRVVLLLADRAVRESGWGPRAAVALSRRWVQEGASVLLLDGDPAEPALHEAVGGDNGEGVTDAVLYGVSPLRMARAHDEGFLFAPAGTVVAEPSTVLRHPRWSSVLAACRQENRTVVLYLPAGVPGVDALAAQGDLTLRLATASAAGAGPADVPVLYPTPGREGDGVGPADDAETAAAGAPSAAGAPGAGSERKADAAPKAPSASPRAPGGRSGRGLEPRPVKRRASVWVILLVLILVGGVLAAAWLGYIQIPGFSRTAAPALLPGLFAGLPGANGLRST